MPILLHKLGNLLLSERVSKNGLPPLLLHGPLHLAYLSGDRRRHTVPSAIETARTEGGEARRLAKADGSERGVRFRVGVAKVEGEVRVEGKGVGRFGGGLRNAREGRIVLEIAIGGASREETRGRS